DLIETWIAAQRVPEGHQFQLAIAEVAWFANRDGKLFAGEIFVANPRSNHRQILDHCDAPERVFFYRTTVHRATAFAPGFFLPPESGVDQTKHAQCWTVIWLSLDNFLLVREGSGEDRRLRLGIVLCYTGDNPFHKWTIKENVGART